MTEVAADSFRYTWDSNWAKVPAHIAVGRTHGVVVDAQDRVHVFNQSKHGVLTFDPEGNFIGTWAQFPSDRFLGAHGMTLVTEGDQQFLWLTDERSGEVVKTTLDGQTVMNLARPAVGVYEKLDAKYSPTWVAVSPVDGTIYVADGYGSGYISRYDKTGKYIDSFNGSQGEAGAFNCPHGVWIGVRQAATGLAEPVLYVTDRANHRIQVFDLKLNYVKSFYMEFPCAFAPHPDGKTMVVPDLFGAVTVLDEHDAVVGHLGEQRDVVKQEGWPDLPAEKIVAGKFNSPHGAVVDRQGNIYVVEWIAGGRITRLAAKSVADGARGGGRRG
jgi:DNA-binding beta-propeller fold protein YncE